MSVAVIGAGIAGLCVARALSRAGRTVVVFDKGREVGGRMSTRRGLFDHGAQYFTVRDRAFGEAVATWEAAGVIARGPHLEDDQQRFRGAPGMDALTRHLADGLAVRSRVRIARIACGANGWELADAAGDWFGPFESVAVAVPAPQAVPLLEPLPDFAQRVAAVEMDPCWAGMFLFEEPLGPEFDGQFPDREGMAWMARRATPRGEAWVLHADPEWTRAHLEDDALPLMRAALATLLDRELPAARYERAHLWRHARTSKPLGEAFLFDSMRRVGVCGDWCLGQRVEEAWCSGRALSRAMLA